MRIFSLFEKGPIVGFDDLHKTDISGRRWSFYIEPKDLTVGFHHEVLWGTKKKWDMAGGYYLFSIKLNPLSWIEDFGFEEMQYDGFHCSFCLGPFAWFWLR